MKQKSMIDGIQILRGLAAILVIIRHGTKEVDTFGFGVGQFGVDLFFVISGFVIYLTSTNVSFSKFVVKRTVRIIPMYWFVTFLTLIAAIFTHKAETSTLVKDAILSIFFIPHGNLFPTLYVGWTLNYEMWFYVMFGFLIFFKADLLKGITITILSFITAGLLILSIQDWVVTAPTVPLLPITIEFLAGVWVAHFYSRGFSLSLPICCYLILLSVVWLLICPNAGAYSIWRPLVWAMPAIAIIVAFLGLERYVQFKNFRLMMLIGNASYATYLIHPLVVRSMMLSIEKLNLSINSWVMLFSLIVVSLLAGITFHLTLERFFQRFFNTLFLSKQ